MHCRTKFHQNRSDCCWDIAFNNFQNGGHPLSWIFKSLIFWAGGRKLWTTNMWHHAKFRNWPIKRFLRYRDFSIFKMATVRHLGFWIFLNFWFSKWRGQRCIIIPNFIKIGRTATEILPLTFFKMAAVRHLAFLTLVLHWYLLKRTLQLGGG